ESPIRLGILAIEQEMGARDHEMPPIQVARTAPRRPSRLSGYDLLASDPRSGESDAGSFIVPDRARNPPARPVPVKLEIVHAPTQDGSVGDAPGFVHAPHLSHIAEPFDAMPNLELEEAVLDERGVVSAAKVLRRHHGRHRLSVALIHADEH